MAARGASLSGWLAAGAHYLPVAVYFEDTDLSGTVYHANYLRFLERGRSAFLQALGIDQRAFIEQGEGVYAVADLGIRYRKPARLADRLLVKTRVAALTAATITVRQTIRRDDIVLVDADVRIAFLTPAGRPRRQPVAWLAKFRALPTTGA